MERELRWTERASSDIEAIVRYVARRDPQAAGRIGMGIYDRAQELLSHAKLGSLEASLHDRSWRNPSSSSRHFQSGNPGLISCVQRRTGSREQVPETESG
jgi:plasmid stabilization system protein ParE